LLSYIRVVKDRSGAKQAVITMFEKKPLVDQMLRARCSIAYPFAFILFWTHALASSFTPFPFILSRRRHPQIAHVVRMKDRTLLQRSCRPSHFLDRNAVRSASRPGSATVFDAKIDIYVCQPWHKVCALYDYQKQKEVV
jgi:hypothetical protein